MVFFVLVTVAVLSRTTGHLWNLTAMGAVALFAGAYFSKKWVAVLAPMLALLISDMVIGFDVQSLPVYFSYVLIVSLGFSLKVQSPRSKVVGFSLLGTLLFFLITNFSFWYPQSLYPHTFSGVIQSYIMGLPFLRNQLIGDLGFTILFFELAKALKLQASVKSSVSV